MKTVAGICISPFMQILLNINQLPSLNWEIVNLCLIFLSIQNKKQNVDTLCDKHVEECYLIT